jgi:hypothetical protein
MADIFDFTLGFTIMKRANCTTVRERVGCHFVERTIECTVIPREIWDVR